MARTTASHCHFVHFEEFAYTTSEVINHILIGGEHKADVAIAILLRGFATLEDARLFDDQAKSHHLTATTRHQELSSFLQMRLNGCFQTIAIMTHFIVMTSSKGVVKSPQFSSQSGFGQDV